MFDLFTFAFYGVLRSKGSMEEGRFCFEHLNITLAGERAGIILVSATMVVEINTHSPYKVVIETEDYS